MLEILAAGPLTTIQDLGRHGHQSLGVPVSGAMDLDSLRLANILCGNPPSLPALEATYAGFEAIFHAPAVVAVTGSDLGVAVNGTPVPRHRPLSVQAGDVLSLSGGHGLRCYLAIAGGFKLEAFLGSCSAYLRGGFPGLCGRPLRAGDRLDFARPPGPGEIARLTRQALPDWFAPNLPAGGAVTLRAVLGPQADHFDAAGVEHFLGSPWQVSRESDRMGCRLEGEPLPGARSKQIISDGAALGAIQVPGNGLPIILLADRQPTGGYPKIATVISADVPLLAHCHPGTEIRFVSVPWAEAVDEARRHDEALRRLAAELAVARATVRCRLSIDGVRFDAAVEPLD
ncbi:MAG: biotin-dependent carboxyltransferase family protein [Chloroflexota bacterium]